MNLSYIREHKIDDRMIDLLNTKFYDYPDQDIINIVCKDKIKYISNIYNSTKTIGFSKNAKIIHYIAENKGWVKESPKSDIWFKYYYERRKHMIKVRCILQTGFNDTETSLKRNFGDEFDVSEERAKFLESVKAVEIIEVPVENKETPKEKVVKEKKTEKKLPKKGKKIDTEK